MAKKGGDKSQKRFNTSKIRFQEVKSGTWSIKSTPGPFNAQSSIPLGFLLRNLIGVGRTLRETKIALNEGKIQVNGKTRRDYRFSTGFHDTVSVNGLENDYRIIYNEKGRLAVKEEKKSGKKSKYCKIKDKKKSKDGKIQLTTNDGRSIFVEKGDFSTGDSIEIELPSQNILNTLKFEKGAKIAIVGGKHAGTHGTVSEIKQGSMKSKSIIKIKSGSKEFETTAKNAFVVGEEK